MTIAIVTLAMTNAAAIAGLIAAWLAYRGESRMAVAAAVAERDEERRADAAVAERDAAMVAHARADASYANERAAHVETARLYTAALEMLSEYRAKEIVDAHPDAVAPAVVRMLQDRASQQTRSAATASGGDGRAVPTDVPEGRPAADAGPAERSVGG